ncbi:MAG: aminotransferase class I/II-fold pyridoxal phosphate-dependent enzyme, partial [Candidatus Diapherotrites archaeon]|nr:aminotransferase class I/II-fold pyridoxal phosphate-dependent enzyme [Candidatus Diapherotrites archaeon]
MAKNLKFLESERTIELPKTIFPKLFAMAETVKGIISLGPGEPDFSTPNHIIQFAKKKLDEGFTHYSSSGGRPDLKEAIAKKLQKENKISVRDPEKQVIVTAGSTEALFLAMAGVLDVTEEIIIPNPGFLAYRPMAELISAVPVSLELSDDDGFQIDPDKIKKLITPKTTAIMLNSPSNPTGTVFKRALLEEIADIAIEKNLMIFSDEAYEKFVFSGVKHVSIGSFNGMQENVVTFQSFSKTFAMPGFRVGYASGPEWLIKDMEKTHVYTSLATSTISQLAALEAMQNSKSKIAVQKMSNEYEKRNKFICKRLQEIPEFELKKKPEGAFYAFPR